MIEPATARADGPGGSRAASDETADARYVTANIPVFLLRCLAATLADLGFDPSRITLGFGLTLDDLADPSCRVSFRQGHEIIRRALRMARGYALGLETGSRETITSIGLVGYAMITSRTLGAAIDLGLVLQKDTGSMLEFDKRISGHDVVVSASTRFHAPDITVFLVEEAFASFLQIGRGLVAERARPRRIELAYPPPACAEAYRRIFDCEIRFGCTENLFVYDAGELARPLITSDPLSHREVMSFLERNRARNREAQEVIDSVERVLRQNLRQPPNCERVAQELGLSERTLRRRLAEFATSFQDLLDRQRRNRALELLANAGLTIDEVALAVGFTDAHNFRRAFRRWTGSTPGAVRSDAAGLWPE